MIRDKLFASSPFADISTREYLGQAWANSCISNSIFNNSTIENPDWQNITINNNTWNDKRVINIPTEKCKGEGLSH